MYNKWKAFICLLCLTVCICTGCRAKDSNLIISLGMGKEDLFQIGSSVCKRQELELYYTNFCNQYEDVFGEEIWSAQSGGVTLRDSLKNSILEQLMMIKGMSLMAKERQLALSEDQENAVEQMAKDFLRLLEEDCKDQDATLPQRELLEKMYQEYYLAQLLYEDIIADVNPEISDDEARIVTIWKISVPREDREKAEQLYLEVQENPESFYDVAAKNQQDGQVEFYVGRGGASPQLENIIFNMANQELSQLIEEPEEWCIIKCVSTFNEAQTQVNKEAILKSRQELAFKEAYESFDAAQAKKLQDKVWKQIKQLEYDQVTQQDFLEIFNKHL